MKIKVQTLSSELNPYILHAVIGGKKAFCTTAATVDDRF